ncbi:hypothetical protein TSAR_004422 [Trichomalopsis sarcophagae]|uniref:Uncharacterized protein n=1 Tax=Trichomalopsis sarcophagae TaxID=543379 RepID=A0A232FAT2_9HYME|nr:hypothetical protein TSAR_004422 [Trichomalopsis sarcophagae]
MYKYYVGRYKEICMEDSINISLNLPVKDVGKNSMQFSAENAIFQEILKKDSMNISVNLSVEDFFYHFIHYFTKYVIKLLQRISICRTLKTQKTLCNLESKSHPQVEGSLFLKQIEFVDKRNLHMLLTVHGLSHRTKYRSNVYFTFKQYVALKRADNNRVVRALNMGV